MRKEGKKLRQRYKVSDDMVLLGFVGRLQYQEKSYFLCFKYIMNIEESIINPNLS